MQDRGKTQVPIYKRYMRILKVGSYPGKKANSILSEQNIENCLLSLSFLKEWIILKKGEIAGNGDQ